MCNFHSLPAVTIPQTKAPTAPASATAAISEEKLNATQRKFQNFDSELTQLISGLKSNLSKETDESPQQDDDKLLLDDIEPPLEESPIKLEPKDDPIIDKPNDSIAAAVGECSNQINVNKPLAEIVIDLNEVRPHDEYAPRSIMDEKCGLKITLNFIKDKPRPDVAVLVINTTNHNKLPVKNFQIEASVQKVEWKIQILLESMTFNFSKYFHWIHFSHANCICKHHRVMNCLALSRFAHRLKI